MSNEKSPILSGLNSSQLQAVAKINGPSLIIAGAGSGKTKVLTCKIAYILENGCAPDSVLALTFTNKASSEMKSRIGALVGEGRARRLWMGTFHSIFSRFLREEAELIGYPKNYTIYDTNDSRNVVKACIKELQLDDKIYKPNEVFSRISMAKNNLVTAEAYSLNNTLKQIDASSKRPLISDIYSRYSKKCFAAGAMDFDDILLKTNILFRDFPEALDRIRSRFKYILVDEFQDTNLSQYLIVKKLASEHKNITVVGDDAQSIYSFRGARIENILNFKKDFTDAVEVKLERNYRSTKTIVEAANSIINRNTKQFKKNCYSEGADGDKIELISAFTEQEEGFMVVASILDTMYKKRNSYKDFAILYRTNNQSRVMEEALRRKNVPYKIFAAHSFYERAEIKNVIAYFRYLLNPKDDESFLRIVNFPARGIGETTISRLKEWANANGCSISEVLLLDDFEAYSLKIAVVKKLRDFVTLFNSLRRKSMLVNAYLLALDIDKCFGIMTFFQQDRSPEGQSRLQNIEELFNSIKEFVEEGEAEIQNSDEVNVEVESEGADSGVEADGGIGDRVGAAGDFDAHVGDTSSSLITMDLYIQNVSLISDVDSDSDGDDDDKLSLMTIHSAKGLEFPYVYIIGVEENLFPSANSSSSEREIEEERRLFYVAVTRAKEAVKISFAHSRIKWGEHVSNAPSRFIKEIDKKFILNPLPDKESFADMPALNGSGNRYFTSQRVASHTKPIMQRSRESTFINPNTSSTIKRDPNFVADSPLKLQVGQKVEHERFGPGTILSLEGSANDMKAIVDFVSGGRKTLLLKFAKIRIISQ